MKDGDNVVYIAKLKGNAYEMGQAYGELFKEELQKQFKNIDYMYPQIAYEMLENFGIPAQYVQWLWDHEFMLRIAYLMLDINWEIARPYVPMRF